VRWGRFAPHVQAARGARALTVLAGEACPTSCQRHLMLSFAPPRLSLHLASMFSNATQSRALQP